MPIALLFLLALLAIVVVLNWHFLADAFGFGGRRCRWSRIDSRDRDGKSAWFCPACRREELVRGNGQPPDCDRAGDRRNRAGY